MNKYVDYKATIWTRLHFSEDTNMSQIVNRLERGDLPSELCDEDLGYTEMETLLETEEFIKPIENDGQSTIEVYEGDNFQECIWDNSFESELKRKENE